MGTISTDPVGKGKIDAFESDFNKLAERTGCSMDSSTTPRQNGQQPRDHYVQGRHYPDRYPLYMFTVVREYPSNQQEYEDTHNIYSKVHYLILLYSPFPATRKRNLLHYGCDGTDGHPCFLASTRLAIALRNITGVTTAIPQLRRYLFYNTITLSHFKWCPPHSARTSACILRLCLISAATRLIYCELQRSGTVGDNICFLYGTMIPHI